MTEEFMQPLPAPAYSCENIDAYAPLDDLWSEAQMRAYALAAVQAAVAAERERITIGADTIARELQSWLDWHARDCERDGITLSDDQHIMCPPVWPSRGVLKNWIALMRQAQHE